MTHGPAAALIRWIGQLPVTQGDGTGSPFPVLPWERRFLQGAFAPDVETAALSIGRGNGKTALVAAVGAAALEGPIAAPRAETIIVCQQLLTGADRV